MHVDVQGLEPDRWCFYRFLAGGEASPVGRTRTFPQAQARTLTSWVVESGKAGAQPA